MSDQNSKPSPITSYNSGDVLARGDERAVVLETYENGKRALLMPLPHGHGETFAADEAQMVCWSIAYLPGPRLVDVRKRGTNEVVWLGYMPDFTSAVSVFIELGNGDDRRHDVTIYPQHDDERDHLDRLGYYRQLLDET